MADSLEISAYSISRLTGFMPETPTARRLPEYYDPWELVVSKLPALNKERKTREAVLSLPVLEVNDSLLTSEEFWRRAYTVLTFLGQSFIWVEGENALPKSIPKCIALPWFSVANRLGLPPVMTYASTTLFNWYLADPSKAVQPDNLSISITCTGTRDEEWFYLVPLYIELETAPVLNLIQEMYKLMARNDQKAVEGGFRTLAVSIQKMIMLLNKMYDHCSPDVFYEDIRPYQAGSKGLDAFPNGIVYEGVDSKPKMFSGASAAQNSCIPSLDIFLGVEHKGETEDFLRLQRHHMPPPHRNFLEALEAKQPSAREYVMNCNNHNLTSAYDEAVKCLVELRAQHIILVTRYIIQPKNRLSQKTNKSLEAKGTGGSDFMVFLKSSKNETQVCKLCEN